MRTGARPHRILRLAIAAGTVAAGCCLILAMVALVVAMGQTRVANTAISRALRTRPPVTASQAPRPQRRDHVVGTAGPFVVGTAIARFAGTGIGHAAFVVASPGTWGLSWSFACSRAWLGNFAVSERTGRDAGRIQLATSGASGHGLAWSPRDPGRHALAVRSNCFWAIKIVLPRR